MDPEELQKLNDLISPLIREVCPATGPHKMDFLVRQPRFNAHTRLFYLTLIFTVIILLPARYFVLPLAVTFTLILYTPFFVPFFTVITPVFLLMESFAEEPFLILV